MKLSMKIVFLSIISSLLLLHYQLIQAKDSSLPTGCKRIGYLFSHKIVVLYPKKFNKKQGLYFFYNKTSSEIVNLYQMRTGNEPFTMYLNNVINVNEWGGFSSNESKVKFICTIKKEDKSKSKETKFSTNNLLTTNNSQYGRIVNCYDVLDVCQFPNVKYANNNEGSYWAVTSNSLENAIQEIIEQGILLRW